MNTSPILTLPELKTVLKFDNTAWPAVAKATGVSEHTLRKLAYGDRKNPTYELLAPLFAYFNSPVQQERRASLAGKRALALRGVIVVPTRRRQA